ncbi:MAG: APC family permease [Clostridiales Family XIII bacterium]|jgi:amino acid transporter|nr:APC family permease [Clostridiales Family XIII bacterium]
MDNNVTLNSAAGVGLKKTKMGLLTVAFMIFNLCAGGCFGIEEMVSGVGPGMTLALLLVIPVIYGYPIGLMCAELGSAIPDEGGFYEWPKKAFGEFWGFQAGWWRTIATYIDNTLYVILAGTYVMYAFNLTPMQGYMVKVACITVFIVINLVGLKEVGVMSSVLATLVLVAFTTVAIVALFHLNVNPVDPFIPPDSSVTESLGTGLAIAMWCYCGYESMSSLAGEMENPQVIPKALVIAIPAIAFIYIFPTITSVSAIGHWDEWAVDGGYTYATVLETFLPAAIGGGIAIVFAFVAVAANLGIYNSYVASGSRGFFVLAKDNLCPRFLAKVGKRSGVPYFAVILMGITNAILCLFAFEAVVVIDVFVYMFSQALTQFAGIKLRRMIPVAERPKETFRIPFGEKGFVAVAIVPLIVIAVALYINGTDYFIGGIIGVVSGPIAYIVFKRIYKGLYVNDPVNHPINPRTKLGVGDLKHISNMLFIIAAIALVGAFFLPFYEGSWANGYVSDMAEVTDYGYTEDEWTTLANGDIWIKGYYEGIYGPKDIFGTMILAIRLTVPIAAVAGIILRLYDRRTRKALEVA